MDIANMYHTDNLQKNPSIRIKNSFKCVTLIMKIIGLLFSPNRKNKKIKIYTITVHTVGYCILWLNVLRYFTAYKSRDSFRVDLVLKFIQHAFFLKCALSLSTCTIISRKWRFLFKLWDKYTQSYPACTETVLRASKRDRISAGILVGLIISIIVILFYFLFWTDRLAIQLVSYVSPLAEDINDLTLPIKTVTLIFQVYLDTICLAPLILLVCFCLALRDEFENFNTQFRNDLQQKLRDTHDSGNINIDVEYYRHWHQEINKILQICDNMWSAYVLNIFVVDVAVICGSLYMLVFLQADTIWHYLTRVIMEIVPLVSFLSVTLVCVIYAGTKLHLAAIGAKYILYSFALDKIECNTRIALQYSTFLTRLTEGHIGITGWKLFHINKMTIKMIVLMVVSYTLMLLKFGPSNDTDGPMNAHTFTTSLMPNNVTENII